MKINVLIVAAAVTFASCQTNDAKKNVSASQAATDTANYTTIKWLDSSKNIGVLNFGEQAEIKFRFKNTGNKPLFIISAVPGCGCTVADYPKEALAPGEEGEIKAAFDSKKGSVGAFSKNITVTTNTKGTTNTNLNFNGEIKKAGESNTVAPTPVPANS